MGLCCNVGQSRCMAKLPSYLHPREVCRNHPNLFKRLDLGFPKPQSLLMAPLGSLSYKELDELRVAIEHQHMHKLWMNFGVSNRLVASLMPNVFLAPTNRKN